MQCLWKLEMVVRSIRWKYLLIYPWRYVQCTAKNLPQYLKKSHIKYSRFFVFELSFFGRDCYFRGGSLLSEGEGAVVIIVIVSYFVYTSMCWRASFAFWRVLSCYVMTLRIFGSNSATRNFVFVHQWVHCVGTKQRPRVESAITQWHVFPLFRKWAHTTWKCSSLLCWS